MGGTPLRWSYPTVAAWGEGGRSLGSADDAELGAAAVGETLTLGDGVGSGGGAGADRAELLFGHGRVELVGGDRAGSKHGDDVAKDLDEPAFEVEAADAPLARDPHLAGAEAADERGMARGDADLAVVQRQGHELGRLVTDGPFRSYDDALHGRETVGGRW